MKVQFHYQTESKQNPFIGFTSFNHFRNGPLYSDCIVGTQSIAGCETESFECYPVPDGVEEMGREQGYHPDSTVAYVRFLWKEFEPEQGKYHYAFMDDILQKARENGQTVMLRLMPHSTCERDDVPEWLKKMMHCPSRPAGKRVKDSPTDPRYLKLFGQAVEKLGEKYDSDPTLDCVDVSLGGAWGEGSQEFAKEDMQALMDIYIRVFRNTKLLGQYSNVEMLQYIASHRPIGWRADAIGSPGHMNIMYPAKFPLVPKELWKTAPISFESYWWISEWYRHGWQIDECIETTLQWHMSTFNTKSLPIPWQWKDKVDQWVAKMGYHFVIDEAETETSIENGEILRVKLTVDNVGVAPIYNSLPLYVRLKNEISQKTFKTNVDIRRWVEGKYTEDIEIRIPVDFPKGEYTLQIGIGGNGDPSVVFATNAPQDGDYSVLTSIQIK